MKEIQMTETRIVGGDPSPVYQLYVGDRLTTLKKLVEKTDAEGLLTRRYDKWIDRQNGKGFQITGATTLRLIGWVNNAWAYEPTDAKPEMTDNRPEVFKTSASRNIILTGGTKPGFNLSGGEFDGMENGALLPTLAELQSYLDKGGRHFRLPVKLVQLNNAANLSKIIALAELADSYGCPTQIDVHEYRPELTQADVDTWIRIAPMFPASMMIDPMNEPKRYRTDNPKLFDYQGWAVNLNWFIAAVRAGNVKNIIAAEYPGWSAAFRYKSKGESATKTPETFQVALQRIGGLKDPLGLTMVSGHSYLDDGSSGTDYACSIYTHIKGFCDALAADGLIGQIGETAGGSGWRGIHPTCTDVWKRQIDEAYAATNLHSFDVWGGGDAWKPDYIFKVEQNPKGTFAGAPATDYVKSIFR